MHTTATHPAHASEAVTRGIRVRVEPYFLPEHSDAAAGKWVFAYHITMTNEGSLRARLLTRHWIIIDGNGQRREVQGDGVVGQHPDLAPGEHFTYDSFCPLDTPWGTMEGSFHFMDERGEAFDVAVARFYLAVPAPAQIEPKQPEGAKL